MNLQDPEVLNSSIKVFLKFLNNYQKVWQQLFFLIIYYYYCLSFTIMKDVYSIYREPQVVFKIFTCMIWTLMLSEE